MTAKHISQQAIFDQYNIRPANVKCLLALNCLISWNSLSPQEKRILRRCLCKLFCEYPFLPQQLPMNINVDLFVSQSVIMRSVRVCSEQHTNSGNSGWYFLSSLIIQEKLYKSNFFRLVICFLKSHYVWLSMSHCCADRNVPTFKVVQFINKW